VRRRRSATAEGEDGSYLASVSDLMSALMFIFIIALAVSVLSFNEQKKAFEDQKDVLTGTTEERRRLLQGIEKSLREKGETRIKVDSDNGVIRFGEAILFDSGRADVRLDGIEAIARLRIVLEEVLPCYSGGRLASCGERGARGTVDAVFVEGHTDSVPIQEGRGRFSDNWELSAARARTVFRALVEGGSSPSEPVVLAPAQLASLKNENGQSIFSISGYADQRPVDTTANDPNRRIDLRFVMVPPKALLQPEPATRTVEGMDRR
jgi:chemotaxis protein MotB